MSIPKALYSPVTAVKPDVSVREAACVMKAARVGAVMVVEGEGRLLGILSERDIMTKVVSEDRDPAKTTVGDVMVSPVITIGEDGSPEDALKFMSRRHIRHLPVLDAAGAPIAMLSIRDMLRDRIEELDDENKSLEAFITADGPGG